MTGASSAEYGSADAGNLFLCHGAHPFETKGGTGFYYCGGPADHYNDPGLSFALINVDWINPPEGNFTFVDDAATVGVSGYNDGRLWFRGDFEFDGPLAIDGDLDMHGHKIIHLGPGDVSPGSMDGVNGSQVYDVFSKGSKYFHALSSAADSNPAGNQSIAIGPLAEANGGGSIAIGYGSQSTGGNSLAIGSNALASAGDGVALGAGAIGTLPDAIAVGSAGHERQIVNLAAATLGTDAVNLAQLNAAVAKADVDPGNVVVYDSSARTAVVLGGSAAAPAVSLTNLANGTRGGDAVNVALLKQMGIDFDSSGNPTNALVAYDDTSKKSVTLGGKAASDASALTNVAVGAITAESRDAVVGSQLYGVASSTSTALGGDASVSSTGGIVAPAYSLNVGSFDDVGSALDALDRAVSGAGGGSGASKYVKVQSVSSRALATGAESIAIGGAAAASGNGGLAIGAGARASFDSSVAFGVDATSNAADSVSVGSRGSERRLTNLADGQADTDAATVAQLNALSQQASRLKSGGTMSMLSAAGAATNELADPVEYDSDARSSVTLGGAGSSPVKLTNLQNASITATSTDAVNGAQLHATTQQITQVETAIGNLGSNRTGSFAANTSAAAATAGGVASISAGGNATADGAMATAVGESSRAAASFSVAIGANSVADRSSAVSVGSTGNERVIANVAAGTQGNDVINVNQLQGVASAIEASANRSLDTLRSTTSTVQKNAYAGAAAAMAMPSLTPATPGNAVFAGGGGTYMGGSALAVSSTYRSLDNQWLVNGGLAVTSTGTAGARVQVGYEF